MPLVGWELQLFWRKKNPKCETWSKPLVGKFGNFFLRIFWELISTSLTPSKTLTYRPKGPRYIILLFKWTFQKNEKFWVFLNFVSFSKKKCEILTFALSLSFLFNVKEWINQSISQINLIFHIKNSELNSQKFFDFDFFIQLMWN